MFARSKSEIPEPASVLSAASVAFDSPKSPTATVVIAAPFETISKPNSLYNGIIH